MQVLSPSSSAAMGRRFGSLLCLLLLAMLWPALAWSQTSIYCPAPLTATVAWGGSVDIDVSSCDGIIDGGMSGPIAPLAAHGSVTIGTNSGGVQFVTYAHNGSTPAGGGSDAIWLEDENTDTVLINITISAAVATINVSPTTLPTMTAGTPFSQTLTSTGGVAPYTYSLQSGALPLGLTLTSGGVISGTPTQRGGYSFTVRSTDSNSPTPNFADKGYTGTVQNPTLMLVPNSGTAIQTVPFSQTLSTTGGVAPHTYQLETGSSFPAGISISSAGVISGTTSAAPGSYPVTIRVTDNSTGPGAYFELESYTLTVSPPPSVSIAVSPASVAEDGATNLTFTVTRSLNLSSPTVVNISTAGTATPGVDYTGAPATVSIPAGATTATFVIDPTVDGTVEPDETVTFSIAAGTGYTIGAPSNATATILNDDVPSATITVSPAAVAEDGATNLIYTVTLNQAAFNPISVSYTIGGTATNGTDYTTTASPLIINTGNTTGTITVDPAADATIEVDETVSLTLASGTGYTVGMPNSATGTILNDDLPSLTINDVTAPEGNAGTTNFTFAVNLSQPAGPGGVTFDITTANGTATAGVDYIAQSLTGQTIPAGSSTYTFTVLVNGDSLNEPTETFFVNVANVTGATVVDGQGLGTIVNDDPLPSLSIGDVSVNEGSGGSTNATFNVTLSTVSGQNVSVDYATADDTATQPADYTSTSGSLTFLPGQTVHTMSVSVVGDTLSETNETFFVNLSGAINATISDSQGIGTIIDDDAPVANPVSETVPYSSSSNVVPTSFTGAAPTSVAIASPASHGTATASGTTITYTPISGYTGTDSFTYTGTNSAGTSAPATISITVSGPTLAITSSSGGTSLTATVGQSYTVTFTFSGGQAPYQGYSITSIPAGLGVTGFNNTSITISGTPTVSGTFTLNVSGTDSSTGTDPDSGKNAPFTVNQSFTLNIGIATVSISPPSLPNATVGSAYNQAITASGGIAPYSFNVVTPSSLPPGMTLSAAGVLSGTPTAGGTYAFQVSATDSSTGAGSPSTASANYTLTVDSPTITLTPANVPDAQQGSAYSQAITASGGTATYSYQVTGGALPNGISLTPVGLLNGTSSVFGSFNFTVTATDSSSGTGPYTGSQAYALTVIQGAPIAEAVSTSVAYNSSANPVTTSFSAAGGVADSLAISTAASHGVASVSGLNITYTPTSGYAGTDSFEYTGTNTTGTSAPATVTVTVQDPVISVTAGDPLTATVGAPYTHTFTFSGGASPWSGYLVSNLPNGLSVTANTADTVTVSGTPAQTGSFNLVVSATDSSTGNGPFPGSDGFTLTVAPPVLAISPADNASLTATYNSAFSQTFSVSGGIGPFTYSQSGTLPPGVSLSGDTLSGTPAASGTFNFSITATDTGAARPAAGATDAKSATGAPFDVTGNYTLTVAAPSISLSPASLPNGTVGVTYSQSLSAAGGVAPYGFTLSGGALPPGLSLSAAGLLSGMPSANGSFSFSVQASDNNGETGSASYTLVMGALPLVLGPPTLPGAVPGAPYSQSLLASGGVPPYSFSVTSGALPPGMSLASDGTLSGTPTQSGYFTFSVTLTDGASPPASTSMAFGLGVGVPAIQGAEMIPTLDLLGLFTLLALLLTVVAFYLPRQRS